MTGPSARVAAQAKLNLHLRVLARDDTGFHSLETIFHRIDLADDLVVTATEGERTLDVEGADTGPVEGNLAYRAAAAFCDHSGWPRGFHIALRKRIPIGAGLGGGSADAAAVLRALNFLAVQPLPTPGLQSLASQIGSDVPFLASRAVMALAWGRGERMLELPPLPRRDILLMTPEFSVSTADAYRWLDEERARLKDAAAAMQAAPLSQDSLTLELVGLSTWDGVSRFARNDFEHAVVARHPMLAEHLAALRRHAPSLAMMTGSGSTLFAALESPVNFAGIAEEHRHLMTTTKTSIDVVQPVRVG